MESVDTREAARNAMFLLAEIKPEGADNPVRVKVRNLSDAGMMAEGKLNVSRGDTVAIHLRNIEAVSGTIAWVAGARIGIAFAEAIDAAAVRGPKPADNDTPAGFEPRRSIHRPHVPGAGSIRAV